MIVLKIGGSLYQSRNLIEWLEKISSVSDQCVIVVPGGGPFSDQVRAASTRWNLPENCSHDMAVLAMQQYAHMMIGLNDKLKLVSKCEEITSRSSCNEVIVWAPYYEVTNLCDLPKNWQTTSDALALWLAIKISAKHLCLVKSVPVEGKTLNNLIQAEVVDQNFGKLLKNYSGLIHFYNAIDSQIFIENLRNGAFT